MIDCNIICEYSAKFLFPAIIGAHAAYYFFFARSVFLKGHIINLFVKTPVVHGHSQTLLKFFNTHVPFLNEAYSPFVFGFTGRFQTVLRSLFRQGIKCNYEE